MSEPTWVPVPQSLEYDLITHAIQHGEIPQEYRICRLVDAPDVPQAEGVAEPDGPGWWAFEGSDDEELKFRSIYLVLETREGLLVGISEDGSVSFVPPKRFKGEWWRVQTPWDDPAPDVPQADWSGAPQWAMFWTVSGTGSIYWWELEPLRFDFSFEWSKMVGKFEYGGYIEVPLGVDWRTLKRQRPAPAERDE